jgi:hypothetical protein
MTHTSFLRCRIEQHVLDTNVGKQMYYAATNVKFTLMSLNFIYHFISYCFLSKFIAQVWYDICFETSPRNLFFQDDYYFTVFNLRKQHQQYISARNADPDNQEENAETEMPCRPKPEDEGAQLLIQPDSPRTPYMPLQFSNSLGKLQAATVKAPRKIIDVGILNSDPNEAAAQKDSRFRDLLFVRTD